MIEFVHSGPETRSTLNRMALSAQRMGYSGVVSRNHSDSDMPEPASPEIDIEVISGVEVRADSVEQLHGLTGKYRDDVEVVCVHGGEPEINRAAAGMEDIDVLCHPLRGRDWSFNHVLMRRAAENDVAVEFNLSDVLRESGGTRVNALKDTRLLLKLERKYDAPFVVSADPYTHHELRAPRELEALLELIGFREEEINSGLRETPQELVRPNDTDVRVVE